MGHFSFAQQWLAAAIAIQDAEMAITPPVAQHAEVDDAMWLSALGICVLVNEESK